MVTWATMLALTVVRSGCWSGQNPDVNGHKDRMDGEKWGVLNAKKSEGVLLQKEKRNKVEDSERKRDQEKVFF